MLGEINKKAERLIEALGLKALDSNPSLGVVKETLGVPPSFAAFLLGTALVFLLCMAFADNLVIMVFGFAVPSYMSFLALESPSKDDDKRWLTYWVAFILLEALLGPIFSLLMKPTYLATFKLALIGVLLAPQTEGALKVYEVLAGWLRAHEGTIKDIYENGKTRLAEAGTAAYQNYTKMD
jgi:hypothetical protein